MATLSAPSAGPSIPVRIAWSTTTAPPRPLSKGAGDFEAAWRDYLPGCTEADFTEYRRQRDWTGWHYATWGRPEAADAITRWTCAMLLRDAHRYPGHRSAHLRRTHEHPRVKEAAN
jgi:hypothetical protein